jgi:LysM repeat protein
LYFFGFSNIIVFGGQIIMKKNTILGLLIIALSILVLAGCVEPKPKPDEPPPPPPPTTTETPEGLVLDGAANHTVASGDTLSDIAAKRYGGSNMYFFPLIRLANAGTVPDPDVIEVGTNLVIPDLQRNLDSVSANVLVRADMLAIAGQYERQGKPNAAATLRNLALRISK